MENELKFKEGDRVEIMINRPFDNETISIGDIGTVVKGFGGGFWMIRFDKEIHGHGENNNEWNISEKEVEKLNTERTSSKYKIFGKPIKRVEDILQVNYAKKKNPTYHYRLF